MRSPFWRIGVFVVVLVWPLLWLYQAWEDTLGRIGQGTGRSIGVGGACSAARDFEYDAFAEAHRLAGVDCCAATVGVVVFCLCSAPPQ